MASGNKVASSQSPMASGGSGGAQSQPPDSSTEYQLRKYLLLLATLVATVTYVAGLNLPGGAWQEDTADGLHHAGDPILQYAHLQRYLTFYYCNATAFAASLVVSLLLLVLDGKNYGWEALLRVVMVLDLLGLMGAYAAGSCRDKFTTVYSALLVCAVFAYVVVAFIFYLLSSHGGRVAILLHRKQRIAEALRYYLKKTEQQQLTGEAADAEKQGGGGGGGATATDTYERRQELHEVLMLLATFAVTITYVAGLNPPGGFWSETEAGHRMSDPVLMEHYSSRYQAFYVCNTTAFVASLLIIILLLDKKLTVRLSVRSVALYGLTITALLGLMGAYAAGSCRQVDDTTYVICLIAGVLAYIFLQVAVAGLKDRCSCFQRVCDYASSCLKALRSYCGSDDKSSSEDQKSSSEDQSLPLDQKQSSTGSQDQNKQNQNQISSRGTPHPQHQNQGGSSSKAAVEKEKERQEKEKERLEKARSLVMLLATLVVSITYSAGMDPPGGLWPDTKDGHKIGDPILLTTHPTRYKVFFYSNSAAFVASLIVILMVQSRFLLAGHTLEAAMILDLFGLIGAYAAGSCRDETTSIYVVALAGIVLVYVVIHIVLFTLPDHEQDKHPDTEQKLENRREALLLLAILAATLTYQAGLTPPGGFWAEDDDAAGHRAGYPVLHDNYRPRYSAFFYCNAASFMASVALIVLLVNPNLYRPGIRCYALFVCMVVGMFGLMGAYAAGSSRDLRTSIYVLTLVVAVFAFVALEVVIFWVWPYLKRHVSRTCIKGYWKQWWIRCCCNSTQEDHQLNTQDNLQLTEKQESERQMHDHLEYTQDHQQQLTVTQESKGQIQDHQENSQDQQLSDSGSSGEKNVRLSLEEKKERNMREYLMLLGVLAASVTYQTGLKPPGGLWQEDNIDDDRSAGSSILHYINKRRYHAFFYCNSTSFMASIVVIILLLHGFSRTLSRKKGLSRNEQDKPLPLWPMHTAIFFDMLGLLGAYAAGSARDWETSRNVIYLVIPVLAYIAAYVVVSIFRKQRWCRCHSPQEQV